MLPERFSLYSPAGPRGIALWLQRVVGRLCGSADPDAYLRISLCVSEVWQGELSLPAQRDGFRYRSDGRYPLSPIRGEPVGPRQGLPAFASVPEDRSQQSGSFCRRDWPDHS